MILEHVFCINVLHGSSYSMSSGSFFVIRHIQKQWEQILGSIQVFAFAVSTRFNRILLWIFVCTVIVGKAVLRYMIFALFCGSVDYFVWNLQFFWRKNLKEKILLFWGKHSTNIWLTHMQFYMIFAPILVMLLLAGSYAVDWIYNPVTRRKMKWHLKGK